MRLSPRLLSIVAGTATVASLAPMAGCLESRAAADPAPAVIAPTSAPVRGNWGAPISPVVMQPIDFAAPPATPVALPTEVAAPGQSAAPTPSTELLASAPEDVPEPDDSQSAARPPRRASRVRRPDVPRPRPDWSAAAACGRG